MQASMGQRSAFCSSSSSRVAQLGRPRALPRVARRCAAQPQQQPAAPESQPQQQPQQQPRWPRQLSLAAAAPAALLLRAGATWAEEAADFEPAYNYPAPDDPVVTLLFTAAIGLLSVVTLGVIYLAVLSWVDSRQEKKDQETGPVKSLAEQQAEIKEKEAERKRVRKVLDKSKGFGN